MRNVNIDRGWKFQKGLHSFIPSPEKKDPEIEVNLPHDYMIGNDVSASAPSGFSGGYYTAGIGSYSKDIEIPAGWENEELYLCFDGVMMNATVEINNSRVFLQHNGYIPFSIKITPYVYFGKTNRISVTVNPCMQPNSRWYTGAGIFRSVELRHMPKLHIADNGIYGRTIDIEYDSQGNPLAAFLRAEVEIRNETLENKIALAEVYLTGEDDDQIILTRRQKLQINPDSSGTAYINMTVDHPLLWDTDSPNLYRLHARVTDLGIFKTHFVPGTEHTADETSILFGIRTVTADPRHGLRINGVPVKLKGGCVHHDNGMMGAVSLYNSEARRISIMKKLGFNAVRTSHNPPSSVFLEACDRLGMFVFDEAFDAWGIMKQPGDYSQYFDTDWEKDMTSFIRRDRSHPSVIIWSTGNEIPERGGMNNGYTLAAKLAEKIHHLDPDRPVSNAICSYWTGLDDDLTQEQTSDIPDTLSEDGVPLQNIDTGKNNNTWEEYSEPFTNGLDIVGYNYMENKYQTDHRMYPDRVMLGSENYPREIGLHWPMIEQSPWVIGDFTWTAFDYIGEAGIGKSLFLEPDDPMIKAGPFSLMSILPEFPWRLANVADVDINGQILPQGTYRSIVWGSDKTFLYSYDPAVYDKTELIGNWGFTAVYKNWNWKNAEGKPVRAAVFSNGDEVELFQNGIPVGRIKAGERPAAELPKSFLFDLSYTPGTLEAVSYRNGKVLSKDILKTTGPAVQIRLIPEKTSLYANGHDVVYIRAELADENGDLVPDSCRQLHASVVPADHTDAVLSAFGSSAPVTEENYTCGTFTTYRGTATAIIRSGYKTGTCTLTVSCDGLTPGSIQLDILPD